MTNQIVKHYLNGNYQEDIVGQDVYIQYWNIYVL